MEDCNPSTAQESKASLTLRDIRELRGLSMDILSLAERTQRSLIGQHPADCAPLEKAPEPTSFFDAANAELNIMRMNLLQTRDTLTRIANATSIGK